jgi:hypothetical protein
LTARSSDSQSAPQVRGPFSRPLRIQDVPEKAALDRRIEANSEECDAIARDAGLPAVASLNATFHVRRRASGRFEVTGRVEATITQNCVVTLEPFEETLTQDISVAFALPSRGDHNGRGKVVVDVDVLDTEDPPDPIVGNIIDLGAVALEFLTLARDFYPKKPGVHFDGAVVGDDETPEPSTFAVLERFRDKP